MASAIFSSIDNIFEYCYPLIVPRDVIIRPARVAGIGRRQLDAVNLRRLRPARRPIAGGAS